MKRLGKIAGLKSKGAKAAPLGTSDAAPPAAATSHDLNSDDEPSPARPQAAAARDLEMSLGGLKLQYEDSRWKVVDGAGGTFEGAPVRSAAEEREVEDLKKDSQRLRTENGDLLKRNTVLHRENEDLRGEVHLLRFKLELLVDMVTLANLDCDQLADQLQVCLSADTNVLHACDRRASRVCQDEQGAKS